MPASFLKNLKRLEASINYSFREQSLLLEALTHSSYLNEHPDEMVSHNERLEFLGDAVLGLTVVEDLYKAGENLSESEMAKLKSFLVSRMVLSDTARQLRVGSFLRLGKGEEGSGGRDKDNILADAIEALFGAVFLDGGYAEAKRIIKNILGSEIRKTITTRKSHDYKTELQEMTQNIHGRLPEYRVISEEGEEHAKTFTVEVIVNGKLTGTGSGRSKKEAQMRAAREALKKLTGME